MPRMQIPTLRQNPISISLAAKADEFAKLATRMKELELQVSGLQTDKEWNEEKLAEHAQTVKTLGHEVADLRAKQTNYDALKEQKDTLAVKTLEDNKTIAVLKSALEQRETDKSKLAKNLAAATAREASLKERVELLTGKVEAAKVEKVEFQQRITNITAQSVKDAKEAAETRRKLSGQESREAAAAVVARDTQAELRLKVANLTKERDTAQQQYTTELAALKQWQVGLAEKLTSMLPDAKFAEVDLRSVLAVLDNVTDRLHRAEEAAEHDVVFVDPSPPPESESNEHEAQDAPSTEAEPSAQLSGPATNATPAGGMMGWLGFGKTG